MTEDGGEKTIHFGAGDDDALREYVESLPDGVGTFAGFYDDDDPAAWVDLTVDEARALLSGESVVIARSRISGLGAEQP